MPPERGAPPTPGDYATDMPILIGLGGIIAIFAIAILLSSDRRAIRPRIVIPAFLLQAGIAVIVLKIPAGRAMISAMADGVSNLLSYAQAGTDFIFGPLADPKIGGASFAISALPVIIFFASLVSILYYLGIMQRIVLWVGGAIEKVTGVSKARARSSSAPIWPA
jgi:CNT family concentrative nucleoside transporter